MKIGCVVDLRPEIEKSFEEALSLGIHRGQLVVWDMSLYTEENAERILKFCREEDFHISALWAGWSGPVVWKYPEMYTTLGLVPDYMRWQRTQDLLRGAEFAARLNVRDVVSHIGYFPDNPFDRTHIEIVHCMRIVGRKLQERGQRFLFETGEELPVTLLLLMNEIGTGNLGVNFDPANLTMSGRANALDALRMFKDCIYGVHGKDATWPVPGQPKGKEQPMGEGETHFAEIVRMLKEYGYNGDITIEREISDPEQRKTDIRRACRLIEDWMKE